QCLLWGGGDAQLCLVQPACLGARGRTLTVWHCSARPLCGFARRTGLSAGAQSLERPHRARSLADPSRDCHPGACHCLSLRPRPGGAEMALGQLGGGRGDGALALWLDCFHALRFESWQLRQDLRLAGRGHYLATLVLLDRLCHSCGCRVERATSTRRRPPRTLGGCLECGSRACLDGQSAVRNVQREGSTT